MKQVGLVCAALAVAIAVAETCAAARVTVLHTNDTHSHVEGGDGFSMFRSAKKVENGLATDYLVLAEYAKAFAPGADGVPAVSSASCPFARFADYPVAYECPNGSGRISIKGNVP